MDITGTLNLWKDYDLSALPLNVSALSEKTENGRRVKEYYFDGYTTVDGKARAFIRIVENTDPIGVILYLPDREEDKKFVQTMLDRGFTVAELNYSGHESGKSRFTVYPQSLASCNTIEHEFTATDDALTSRWFIWACIARRATILLRNLYGDKKLFAFGKGLGGSTVYKLCAFDDGLTAAATALNILPTVTGTGNPIINYRAALDNNAYAPNTKTPIFISVASNAIDGSLDDMAALAQNTASIACFRIVERSFSPGIDEVYDQVANFFTAYISGTPNIIIPKITASNSENKLYFNISLSGENTAEKRTDQRIKLYAAFCVQNPTYRNWTNVQLISLAGNEFMAHVDVLQETKPVYAFVNVSDENGNTSTSELLTVIPKTLGIGAQPTVKQRLIYDGSLGTDVWTSLYGGKVKVNEGPYGIPGVSSETNTLITFKPGDLLYRAENDALLQVILSGEARSVKVEVNNGTERFSCDLDLPNTTEWHKFTLSYNDFKGAFGQLKDWSTIIMLKFQASADFIISSVLWV